MSNTLIALPLAVAKLPVPRAGSARVLLPAAFALSMAISLLVLLPTAAGAQTSPPAAPAHRPRPVHRHAAASAPKSGPQPAPEIKLPASIPAAPGPVHTQYELRYVDIKVGTGAPALPGHDYTVHYTGWLYDGTKFDSSVDRNQPFDFTQGRQMVIIGWDTGFEGMLVGGKRRLFVPYQLAYGEMGKGPIPPKANLIFDVELLAVDGNSASTPTPAQ